MARIKVFLDRALQWQPAPVYAAMLLAGFVLVAALALFALVHMRPPEKTVPVAHKPVVRVHRVAATPKPIAKKPPAVSVPSDFEKEQQMSFSQLMKRWDPDIAEAAKRFAVPQPWIRAVMQIESGGRTMLSEKQKIISTAGAMGLMQLMPSTYADMRRQYGLGADPYDPHDNIMAGAAYLHFLRSKYPYPAMFAAYNDGPGNLEERLANGGLLPLETQLYMGNIASRLENGSAGSGTKVKFTRPNGEAVTINAGAVLSVRAAFPGEYAPGVQTVITVGRLHQGVRESLAKARAAIRAHGGGI